MLPQFSLNFLISLVCAGSCKNLVDLVRRFAARGSGVRTLTEKVEKRRADGVSVVIAVRQMADIVAMLFEEVCAAWLFKPERVSGGAIR